MSEPTTREIRTILEWIDYRIAFYKKVEELFNPKAIPELWAEENEMLKNIRPFIEQHKPNKADIFVAHIENHIKGFRWSREIVCSICGKSLDEIIKEEAGVEVSDE
jgi:hypothetical protein